MELICPHCRNGGPGHPLDLELRCPHCETEHPSLRVDQGPRVAILLPQEDATPGIVAAGRILDALDEGAPGMAAPEDRAYLRALSTYGVAHFGRWATPAIAGPDLDWVGAALTQAEGIPDGPALILGAATAGEVLALPPDREVVALDGSVPLLGFASGVACSGQWLPVEATPGCFARRRVDLPPEQRKRLSQATLLAADAREPPLPTGSFAIIVALNLLDSITHPREVLLQARALLAPGGVLLLSSPFNWDDAVTPPDRRLDADLPPGADHPAAMEARIEALLEGMELRWSDRAIPWPLRIHARLRCDFRLHGMLLQRTP